MLILRKLINTSPVQKSFVYLPLLHAIECKSCHWFKSLGPGQTVNVWRPNTIKHCLVTKHANVEVSGQTVNACLIKHRWNNWYKPLSKHGTHVWYAAVQTNKTSPIKHAKKRNVLRSWSNVWWPSNFIKHDQIRSNTIKQHQTRCPNGKMFGHQTMFDGVWSPKIYRLSRPLVLIKEQWVWYKPASKNLKSGKTGAN